jgi:hypothetical protein
MGKIKLEVKGIIEIRGFAQCAIQSVGPLLVMSETREL